MPGSSAQQYPRGDSKQAVSNGGRPEEKPDRGTGGMNDRGRVNQVNRPPKGMNTRGQEDNKVNHEVVQVQIDEQMARGSKICWSDQILIRDSVPEQYFKRDS